MACSAAQTNRSKGSSEVSTRQRTLQRKSQSLPMDSVANYHSVKKYGLNMLG